MTDDTPAMDALRYYQDKIEPLSNEERIASALIELAKRVDEPKDAKLPCLYPLPDGRRCLECDTCQGRRHQIRIVKWVDSCLQNAQVDSDDFPEPVIITSVGFVVDETDEYLTLARDDMGHDGDYRGLCAIPKSAVQS